MVDVERGLCNEIQSCSAARQSEISCQPVTGTLSHDSHPFIEVFTEFL